MENTRKTPFLLVILDGIGLNPRADWNAVHHARTPTLDLLLREFPHTTLITCGERVGLPDGQMGNSEVGHLNIGAGRVVEQELTRINRAIREGTLQQHPELQAFLAPLKTDSKKALHLVGLISTGGVHSERAHIEELVRVAAWSGVKNVFIHAISDGRDRPPNAALQELAEFEDFISQLRVQYPNTQIALSTLIGRYFAMDRDHRWERTEQAYRLFTSGTGQQTEDLKEVIKQLYAQGISDEFFPAICFANPKVTRPTTICQGDQILFFNFRSDRMRQIVSAFLAERDGFTAFPVEGSLKEIPICSLTEYEEDFSVPVLFPPIPIKNHFGSVLADAKMSQLRIAETEKYPHVTYFFNGGEEHGLVNEERILIPSPREVATYDEKPEMSAYALADKIVEKIESGVFDVIVVNFANGDMVGHTGNFEAAVKAVEAVDTCLGKVLGALKAQGGEAIITADHGNAEQMKDYVTGGPHTFHTLFPVPIILLSEHLKSCSLRDGGSLCDIAPTCLDILGIAQPAEMLGKSLLVRS